MNFFLFRLLSLAPASTVRTPFTASAHVTYVREMSLRVPFALGVVVLSSETTVASGSNCIFPTLGNEREILSLQFAVYQQSHGFGPTEVES